jgi:hypothetical protein
MKPNLRPFHILFGKISFLYIFFDIGIKFCYFVRWAFITITSKYNLTIFLSSCSST